MIQDYLRKLKQSAGNPTNAQIATMSGVPESTVNKLMSGLIENPKFENLANVVVTLGGSLDELMHMLKAEPSLVNYGTPANAIEKAIHLERKQFERTLSEEERAQYKARIQKITDESLEREARFRQEHLSILESARSRHEARERVIREEARRRETWMFVLIAVLVLFMMSVVYVDMAKVNRGTLQVVPDVEASAAPSIDKPIHEG